MHLSPTVELFVSHQVLLFHLLPFFCWNKLLITLEVFIYLSIYLLVEVVIIIINNKIFFSAILLKIFWGWWPFVLMPQWNRNWKVTKSCVWHCDVCGLQTVRGTEILECGGKTRQFIQLLHVLAHKKLYCIYCKKWYFYQKSQCLKNSLVSLLFLFLFLFSAFVILHLSLCRFCVNDVTLYYI